MVSQNAQGCAGAAFERQDWEEAERLVEEHMSLAVREREDVTLSFSRIGFHISEYSRNLQGLSHMLQQRRKEPKAWRAK